MRFTTSSIACVLLLCVGVRSYAADAPTSGRYADPKITLDLAESAGNYTGTITMGTQQFPATAHSNGHGIEGSFTSGNNTFPFTASFDHDTLNFSTGGTNYALKAVPAQPNPLAQPAPANPSAPPAAAPVAVSGPAGYTVLAATESGKSLIVDKPNIKLIKDAFEATFPDLANYFNTRVTIKSSSQSSKDSKSGIATFSLTLNGKELRGIVSCKLRDGGVASIAVVYAAASAPKAEWDKLMHPPAPTPSVADAPPQPVFTLRQYNFPDGTGSIGVAEGWTCKTQSGMDPVVITGPGNQLVFIGNSKTINTPESSVVKVRQQSEALAARTQAQSVRSGLKPYVVPPAEPLLVSPMCDPVEALKVMEPQFSAVSVFNHGPAIKLDKVIASHEATSGLEGGKAADIVYELTYTTNEGAAQFRTHVNLQVAPLGKEAWIWLSKGFSAPVKTFDDDKPVMLAMFKSIKLDADRLTQVAVARNAATQKFTAQWVSQYQQNMQAQSDQWQKDQADRNANWQKQHDETLKGYAEHNKQVADALLQRSRNFDDQIEQVRGTVSLYDTANGHGTTADANDAVDIVSKLYQASMDPNTTVRIPLKDVIDPLPTR